MDDLERQVREFLRDERQWLPRPLAADDDLVRAASIDGDDVWELLERFSQRFGVEMRDLRWLALGGRCLLAPVLAPVLGGQ